MTAQAAACGRHDCLDQRVQQIIREWSRQEVAARLPLRCEHKRENAVAVQRPVVPAQRRVQNDHRQGAFCIADVDHLEGDARILARA